MMPIRWPLHPKPGQYELVYQLVERLSESYQVSYKKFCKTVLGLTPEETNHLRTVLPEKVLVILSNGIDVPIDDLRKRDLNSMFNILCDELTHLEKTHPEEFEQLLNKSVYKL